MSGRDPGFAYDVAAFISLLSDWQASAAARPRALPEHLSPCAIGQGPHRLRCSRWHADLVEGYRLARHAEQLRREAVHLGYPAEAAELQREQPALTFGRWLRQQRST